MYYCPLRWCETAIVVCATSLLCKLQHHREIVLACSQATCACGPLVCHTALRHAQSLSGDAPLLLQEGGEGGHRDAVIREVEGSANVLAAGSLLDDALKVHGITSPYHPSVRRVLSDHKLVYAEVELLGLSVHGKPATAYKGPGAPLKAPTLHVQSLVTASRQNSMFKWLELERARRAAQERAAHVAAE